MKKIYIAIAFIAVFFTINPSIHAQYQTYDREEAIEREKEDVSGTTTKTKTTNTEDEAFRFKLSFGNFSILQSLESQIALSQLSRKKIDDWLRKQENTTLLREMNRQMGKSYTSFSTAQREYFKFYEGGKYGNLGPVARSRTLASQNSSSAKNWRTKAGISLAQYEILDDWIKCGYCDELLGMAYGVNSLGSYDNDNSPGPKFYAASFRDGEKKSFGEAYYQNGLNKSRAAGLAKLAENNGVLLTRISDKRVAHYRSLGWQEKVLQMSAYLVSKNINCSSPVLSCLPSNLAKYRPIPVWNDNTLKEWAKAYSPEIPYNQAVFDKKFIDYLIKTEGLRASEANQFAEEERKAALEEFIDPRNKLCGGYRWKKVGTANSVSIRGLRVIIKNKLHTWIPIPTGETVQNLPSICISVPDFQYVNGRKISVTQADATIKFNIAWSSALYATWFELRGKQESQVVIIPVLLANLELMLNSLTPGSKVSRGLCSGSSILASNAKYCR